MILAITTLLTMKGASAANGQEVSECKLFPGEIEALVDIEESTGDWRVKGRFARGRTKHKKVICGSDLIECTGCMSDGFDHISALYLDFNNLTGILPASVGQFPHLTVLDVSTNELNGPLPNSLGNLKNLQILDLSYNRFEGSFPSSLYDIPNVVALQLAYNDISGDIESLLSSFKRLEMFSARGNRFFQGDLDSPLVRKAFSTHLADTLVELDLSWNAVGGTIPEEIRLLSRLEKLSLSQNELSGSLPSRLPFGLKSLEAENNDFFGGLPDQLSVLPDLQALRLKNNRLSGEIPSGLLGADLEIIDLSGNSFDSIEEPWLSAPDDCTKLKSLDLSNNPFTHLKLSPSSSEGTMATLQPCWRSLEILRIHSANLEGEIPGKSLALPGLKVMDLHNNRLIGSIPKVFSSLENLESVRLDGNYLDSSLPNLSNLPKITHLSLHSNRLSDTLPASLKGMPNLQVLYLHNNHLTGTIPTGLFKDAPQSLVSISLHLNYFKGDIPSSLADAPVTLRDVTVHGNRLRNNPRIFLGKYQCLDLNANNTEGRRIWGRRFKICGTRNDFFAEILVDDGWDEVDTSTPLSGWEAAYGDCAAQSAEDWNKLHRKKSDSIGREFGMHLLDFQVQSRYPDMYVVLADKGKFAAAMARARVRRPDTTRNPPHPSSFRLPSQLQAWRKADRDGEQMIWLLKPTISCCGRGIRLIQGPDDPSLPPSLRGYVAQQFVHPPLLIDGHKFVLRLFTIVTSFRPLRAYHYRDGPVFYTGSRYNVSEAIRIERKATERAEKLGEDVQGGLHLFGEKGGFIGKDHLLTDYYFTLKQRDYEVRAAPLLERFLPKFKPEKIWEDIEVAMAESLVAAADRMGKQEAQDIPYDGSVYEVVGFDILLDSYGRPWVCEVNSTPNMGLEVNKGGDMEVEEEDGYLKTEIMRAMLDIAGVHPRRIDVSIPLKSELLINHPENCVQDVLNTLNSLGTQLIIAGSDDSHCGGEEDELDSQDSEKIDFKCLRERDIALITSFECERLAAKRYPQVSMVFPRPPDSKDEMGNMLGMLEHEGGRHGCREDRLLAWWLALKH